MDFIFDSYALQSAEPKNTINLELPLVPLQRALKSAMNAVSASLRLTKRDGMPILSMTITTMTGPANAPQGVARFGLNSAQAFGGGRRGGGSGARGEEDDDDDDVFTHEPLEMNLARGEREKVITQDIPVRVLHPETVETIMQPTVREPDVHIQLPPLMQLKAISDRFTKLAAAAGVGGGSARAVAPKLELSANMHGDLKLRLDTDALDVESRWDGLENPELDPAQLACALEVSFSSYLPCLVLNLCKLGRLLLPMGWMFFLDMLLTRNRTILAHTSRKLDRTSGRRSGSMAKTGARCLA